MSGLEGLVVVGCVAAVVSAFHGGAELVEIMRERRDRRKKKKTDPADVVQKTQQDMLHSVLLGSADQVDDSSLARRQRFGRRFEEGDDVATMELMKVVMHLQGQVIDALRIARNAEEAYVLNINRLYEFAVADRQAAISSMDSLCQRILQSMPPEALFTGTGYQANPYDMRSMMLSMAPLPVAPNTELRRRDSNDSGNSYSTARTGWQLPTAIEPKVQRDGSTDWMPQSSVPHRADSVISNSTFKNKFGFLSTKIRRDDGDMGSILEYEPFEGPSRVETIPDNYDSQHTKPTSKWLIPKGSSAMPPQVVHERSFSLGDARQILGMGVFGVGARTPSVSSNATTSTIPTPSTSDASSRRSNTTADSDAEIPRSRSRFDSAPEVVTMANSPRGAYAQGPRHASLWESPSAGRIADTIWEPPLPNSEPLDPWTPLDKPTKRNNFHSFCEGAWLTRTAVKSGLSITRKPHGLTTLVPYWQCKKCQFSCIASSSNQRALPQQIYTSQYGIRYRWLFLAKSHMKSTDPTPKAEAYTYGCIFCTAEGKITSAFGTLDTLMEHIAHRHSRSETSSEIKEKTRSIIGRFASNIEAWDVNILECHQPHTNEKAFEFHTAPVAGYY